MKLNVFILFKYQVNILDSGNLFKITFFYKMIIKAILLYEE